MMSSGPVLAGPAAENDPAEGHSLPSASRHVRRIAWRSGEFVEGERALPEETAVALTYNGSTQAVMMASPTDLEDFAIGFSLTERIVTRADEIESLDILALEEGIEARLWIAESCARRLGERRRMMAGPTGCGLCGVDSLAEALSEPALVHSSESFPSAAITAATDALSTAQTLHRETRAVHAAGFWAPSHGLVAAREDLGRHNAVDKLVGAMTASAVEAGQGIVAVTSRVSVEIVQKVAVLGAPVLVAVSAPTALAVRMAERAGMTLVAIARGGDFEVFTHTERVALGGGGYRGHAGGAALKCTRPVPDMS